MAKYRPIKTSIWDDEYILSLKTDEKLFFVYLITNNYTSLCGIYTLSIRYAEMATGIPKKRILEILEKFKIDNKAIYHNGWVRVVNTQKHQNPSPHIMTGIKREEANIPLEIKDTLYRIHTLPYSMDKPIPKPIPKLNIYTPFLTLWNKQCVITHKAMSEIMKKNLDRCLSEFGEEKVRAGIATYGEVVRGNQYYFKHKWTFEEFLSRKNGLRVFVDKKPEDYVSAKKMGVFIS